jgi:hypothetical protein
MVSTKSELGNGTKTGPTGTPLTWSRNNLALNCLPKAELANIEVNPDVPCMRILQQDRRRDL